MSEKKSFHMTPEAFRRFGRAVVDWIADYYERLEDFPVLSQAKPGEIRSSLPPAPFAPSSPPPTKPRRGVWERFGYAAPAPAPM